MTIPFTDLEKKKKAASEEQCMELKKLDAVYRLQDTVLEN